MSNKLLENVNIVLFLNKCDLLELKLANGVMLSNHMTSYGDRPNNYDSISRCEGNRQRFKLISYLPQISRTNSQLCTNLFLETRSVKFTVSATAHTISFLHPDSSPTYSSFDIGD